MYVEKIPIVRERQITPTHFRFQKMEDIINRGGGGTLTLAPGESVRIPPRLYHKFWGEAGSGSVLVGEASRVNDGYKRYHEPAG